MSTDVDSLRIALLCSGCSHVRRGLELFHERTFRALRARGLDVTLYGGSGDSALGSRGLPSVGGRLRPTARDTRSGLILEQRTFTFSFLAVQALRRYPLVMASERAVANLLLEARRRLPGLVGRFRLCYNTSAGIVSNKVVRYDFLRHATPSAYDGALAEGFPADRMWLIPHGFDLTRAKPDRAALQLPEDAFVVLYAGAFIEEKRHAELLELLLKCRQSIPRLFIVFAGEPGPTQESVAARLQEALPGRHRVGLFSPADMPALYASADVCAHGRLGESFCNVFVQANAQGTPVIAHPSPNHQFVLGKGGLYADMTDPDALPAALVEFHRNPELRSSLQRAALANAGRFDLDAVALQFENMFRSISSRPAA